MKIRVRYLKYIYFHEVTNVCIVCMNIDDKVKTLCRAEVLKNKKIFQKKFTAT